MVHPSYVPDSSIEILEAALVSFLSLLDYPSGLQLVSQRSCSQKSTWVALKRNLRNLTERRAVPVSKPIHQESNCPASPQRLYEAPTEIKKFSEFSDLSAQIDPDVGGGSKCFGEQITGRLVQFIPNQRIVQTWHVALWPEGINSTVSFQLTPVSLGRAFFGALRLSRGRPRTSRRRVAADVLGGAKETPRLGGNRHNRIFGYERIGYGRKGGTYEIGVSHGSSNRACNSECCGAGG